MGGIWKSGLNVHFPELGDPEPIYLLPRLDVFDVQLHMLNDKTSYIFEAYLWCNSLADRMLGRPNSHRRRARGK